MNTDTYVVRTRNIDELNKLDIVIDIEGGMFDHHMAGFNVCRPTGEKVSNHTFSFILKFLPSWMEVPNYDDAFCRVEAIVFGILKEIIKDKVAQVATKKELQKRYDCINDGILEIPAQTMPWLEDVVSYNQTHNYNVKFVIFPYPA